MCPTLDLMEKKEEGNGKSLKEEKTTKENELIVIEKSDSAEERLLSILKDPSCISLSATKICKLADISRTTYYQLFKDSEFIRKIEQEAQEILVRGDLPVLNNIASKAQDASQKSHHWAQMFMKMRGRLSDQPVRPAEIKLVFNVNRPPKVISDGETIELFKNSEEDNFE